MKKISLAFCLTLLSSLFCPAQVSPLQFNKNGEFKIVQFTDIHFKYGNPASDIALKRIGEVLDAERPDLVVFTGDVVYAAPADTAMRKVLSYATDRKIPFVVTFGNHDNEQGKHVPNFMMLSVPCLSISNPTVAELNPRLCPHTEILGRQEGCSPALLSGFPFLLQTARCKRVRLAHFRPGELVPPAECRL